MSSVAIFEHERSVGGLIGKTDDAELFSKSYAELEEDGEREEDGGYVSATARWAIGVGVGAAFLIYAAARARYHYHYYPFHGGALQRDSLIGDDAAIPDAHPCRLFEDPNVRTGALCLPFQEPEPRNSESLSDYGMDWQKFMPRGGTATAVVSTPVEDLSYRRITTAALFVAALILFLDLVVPVLMLL